jgi:hypothetical protein
MSDLVELFFGLFVVTQAVGILMGATVGIITIVCVTLTTLWEINRR